MLGRLWGLEGSDLGEGVILAPRVATCNLPPGARVSSTGLKPHAGALPLSKELPVKSENVTSLDLADARGAPRAGDDAEPDEQRDHENARESKGDFEAGVPLLSD
jgi:hypothetical protein